LKSEGITGYYAILLAGLAWSINGLLVKGLYSRGLDSASIVFLRACLSSFLVGTTLALLRPHLLLLNLRDLPHFVLLGVTMVVLSQTLFIFSLTRISMALAVILNYTAPLWVVLLSFFVLRERMTISKMAALVLALGGLALVVQVFPTVSGAAVTEFGVLAAAGSGLFYALYTLLLKTLRPGYHPLATHFWVTALGGLVLGLSLLPVRGFLFPASITPAAWPWLLALTVVPGTAGFCLYIHGLRYIETSRASIVATVEPVSAAVLGYSFLGERLTPAQFLGMALVLAAVVLTAVTRPVRVTCQPGSGPGVMQ